MTWTGAGPSTAQYTHIEPLTVLRLIYLRTYRIAVPQEYESKGKESASVFTHTIVHNYMTRENDRSALRLVATAEVRLREHYYHYFILLRPIQQYHTLLGKNTKNLASRVTCMRDGLKS